MEFDYNDYQAMNEGQGQGMSGNFDQGMESDWGYNDFQQGMGYNDFAQDTGYNFGQQMGSKTMSGGRGAQQKRGGQNGRRGQAGKFNSGQAGRGGQNRGGLSGGQGQFNKGQSGQLSRGGQSGGGQFSKGPQRGRGNQSGRGGQFNRGAQSGRGGQRGGGQVTSGAREWQTNADGPFSSGMGKSGWEGNRNQSRGGTRGGMGGRGNRGGMVPSRGHGNQFAAQSRGGGNVNSFKFQLQRFMEKVKNNTTETNDIMLIANSLYGGNFGFKDRFEIEQVSGHSQSTIFTGALYLGDQFICRCKDNNKKSVKATCYTTAVGILSSYTVDEILQLKESVDEEAEIKEEPKVPLTTEKPSDSVQLFKKLKKILKEQLDLQLNVISRMEQGGVIIKCPVQYIEGSSKPQAPYERIIYEGSLYFNNIHIGIARDSNKKQAKAACYEMAFNRVMSLDASKLSQGLTEEEMAGVVTSDLGILTHLTSSHLKVEPLRALMEILSKPDHKPFTVHFDIAVLDIMKTNPELLYRRYLIAGGIMSKNITCELYLCNTIISNGQGPTLLAAKRAAYKNAEMVFDMSTPESIIREHSVITSEDKKAPDVIEHCVVSFNTRIQSNVSKLMTVSYLNYPEDCTNLSLKNFIIMENTRFRSDRKVNAFGILALSCTSSGYLLEYDFERIFNNVFDIMKILKHV